MASISLGREGPVPTTPSPPDTRDPSAPPERGGRKGRRWWQPPPRNGGGENGDDGGGRGPDFGDGEGFPLPAGKVALLLAMGSMAIVFAALVSAYVVRMGLGGWESIHAEQMGILWANTGLLAATSVALAVGSRRTRRLDSRAARAPVAVALLLGLLFVAGQGLAWLQAQQAGLFVAPNPASSFFYLLTGLHGVHILGGLAVLVWLVAALGREPGAGGPRSSPRTGGSAAGRPSRKGPGERTALAVELSGLYWHFLLAVWLVFFALMLVT